MLAFIIGLIFGAVIMDFMYFKKIRCSAETYKECMKNYIEIIKKFFS